MANLKQVCKLSCVSSTSLWKHTLCSLMMSSRSSMYRENNNGPGQLPNSKTVLFHIISKTDVTLTIIAARIRARNVTISSYSKTTLYVEVPSVCVAAGDVMLNAVWCSCVMQSQNYCNFKNM